MLDDRAGRYKATSPGVSAGQGPEAAPGQASRMAAYCAIWLLRLPGMRALSQYQGTG